MFTNPRLELNDRKFKFLSNGLYQHGQPFPFSIMVSNPLFLNPVSRAIADIV